jgi:hypothetical protein
MKAWLKAGLIGGFIIGIIGLTGAFSYKFPETELIGLFLTCLYLCTCILIHPLIGVFAVAWDPSQPEPVEGAKYGALAGLIVGIIDGVVKVISAFLNILVGESKYLIRNIPPEAITPFEDRIFNAYSSPMYIVSVVLGSLLSILFSVGLGALGGFLYSTMKDRKKAVDQ